MTDVISPQVTYKKFTQQGPKYRYLRLNMSNILSNQVPITATTSTQVHFKLPYNTVVNLAKSKFNCTVVVPAQGAGITSNMRVDCWPFAGPVSLETGNGIQILNLPETTRYTSVLGKLNMKYDDYLTRDASDLCYPCNSTLDPKVPLNEAKSETTVANVAYLEPKYMSVTE